VGIRGDEDREGYISHKPNIQSIFPFRRNIWSQDVIGKVLKNANIPFLESAYPKYVKGNEWKRISVLCKEPLSMRFTQDQKLDALLNINIKAFNKVVFDYLKGTTYSLGYVDDYPVLNNEEAIVRKDVFAMLTDSGVGIPDYYNSVEFEVDGEKGEYARSRSGCYFCFFQQRIEWVWLYEQHPDLFFKAMEYEKDGYTWGQNESLAALIKPERIEQIKKEYLIRRSVNQPKSPFLLDILDEAEGEGCAACFI
jgi:hypothetical protein